MSIKQTWIVEGENTMHCAGCVQTVKFSLSQLEGVEQVEANFRNQEIEVEVNDAETHEQVIAELNNLGYQVRKLDND
jgi:copper chaperone CopZ